MMRYKTLEKKVNELGASMRKCSPYHWQIKAKYTINIWPTKYKAYIDKTNHSITFSEPKDILRLIQEFPRDTIDRSKRKYGGYTKYKVRLYKKSNACAKCKKKMSFKEATVDHIIPISQGGMNNPNNYQLMCEPCNLEKGSSA